MLLVELEMFLKIIINLLLTIQVFKRDQDF